MKVLLKDEKGYFYKCDGEWTACAGSALDFKGSLRAIMFAREKGLSNAEVVLWFDNPQYDISLPVQLCQGQGEGKAH